MTLTLISEFMIPLILKKITKPSHKSQRMLSRSYRIVELKPIKIHTQTIRESLVVAWGPNKKGHHYNCKHNPRPPLSGPA